MRLLGMDPYDALMSSYETSWPHAYTGVLEGDIPFCMIGVGESAPRAGRPWMLSTKDILTVKRSVMEHTRPWVAHFNRLYPYLENFVHVQNTIALAWLAFAGFEFHEDVKIGHTHFRRFSRTLTEKETPS
ncbi:MAG: hypothetical protein ACYTFI_24915 [Planctomycetota bacterium]